MVEALQNLNPVLQALLAGIFTWSITAFGASFVFWTKTINQKVLDAMLGFAAGVMIAASFWSLLAPAIEMSEDCVFGSWVPAAVGFRGPRVAHRRPGKSARAGPVRVTAPRTRTAHLQGVDTGGGAALEV